MLMDIHQVTMASVLQPRRTRTYIHQGWRVTSRGKKEANLMPFYISRFAYTAEASSDASDITEGQEWFGVKEAGCFLGVHAKIIRFYQKNGTVTNS